jgi:MinD-like ATPase involved in chromosome partitioning or flagellar assembly
VKAIHAAKAGQIVTFYSYKGGTGRSMAVANCACWLVKNVPEITRGVLVMDWDLEAPGLHRYFAETAERPENKDRPGVINYFADARAHLVKHPNLATALEAEDGWKVLARELPFDDYLVRDVVKGVDFIKAGNFDAEYSELISTFNWVELYHDFGAVFTAFRDFLLHTYDFCLIDSRTGLNDVSGICTMLLPEKLVTVFTPNRQNVAGVVDLAGRAAEYRISSGDPRTLSIFPLASRIENAELELKTEWEDIYQREFEAKFKSIYQLDACDLTKYFDEVQLPHVSFYSYGEEIALLREERSGALSLKRAYESFFEKLFRLGFAWEEKETATELPQVAEEIPASRFVDTSRPRYTPVENDIYISYAHTDDVSFRGDGGWVDRFHAVLEVRLSQIIGREVRIWRDRKLAGQDIFSNAIEHQLSNTALFIAIISPSYVNSEWCRRELREFLKQAGSGVNVDGRSRVLKVIKTPLPPGQEPEEIQALNTLGYQFYEVGKDGRFREFLNDDKRFFITVDHLAYDIQQILERQERLLDQTSETVEPVRQAVYLAETTPDLQLQRQMIRRELEQRGYHVLPEAALPPRSQALRKVVAADLERSRLSVHMVGEVYGPILDENTSAVEIQNEIAAKVGSHGSLARVIWMPIGVQPSDGRQQKLIDRIQFDADIQRGADVVQTSLEDLKILLQRRLTSGTVAPPSESAEKLIRVYLIFDEPDLVPVQPVRDYLYDVGYEVILPVFDVDASKLMQYHRDNLLLADAVLIYFGNSSGPWLQSKLTDLRKALGWGRSEPFLSLAVLISDPITEEKKHFRTREALVLRDYGKFGAESLRPFIDAIRDAVETRDWE